MNSLGSIAAVCVAIGAITVGVTLVVGHAKPEPATAEYGQRLMLHTARYLPRVFPNQLACASCHIKAGAEPGALNLADAIRRFPHIEERINRCVTGNMNGHALPEAGTEMKAIIEWLQFLATENAAMGASLRQTHDPPEFNRPAAGPDLRNGESLFAKRCADCHGKDGAGLPASTNPAEGYLFPPLWGSDSFNDGADMAGAVPLAHFIKAKMPPGRADLNDAQTWDLAAFIESQSRPSQAK